jgi:TPR repeat protein
MPTASIRMSRDWLTSWYERPMNRTWGVTLAVVIAIAIVGCGPDARTSAEQRLTSEGLVSITLVESTPGVFDFQATRDGVPCRGVVTFSRSWARSESVFSSECSWPTEGEPLVAACEANLATGPCEDAELALFEGSSGVAQDLARAQALAIRACDAGRTGSCHNAAVGYRDGMGVAVDLARARELFTRSCEGDYPRSCHAAGLAFEHGSGGTADRARAEALYRRGCDADEGGSCEGLGLLLAAGGDAEPRDAEARAALERGCALASTLSCRNLAVLLHTGRGGAADEERALQLWQSGCEEHEDGHSCNAFATRVQAIGGEGASERALHFFARACELNIADACAEAGELTFVEGPLRDYARSRGFYDRACQGGDALSCRNFAVMMRDGTGGDPEPARVAETLRRACSLGDEPACADLRAHEH